jgi:hypothetical protein
MTLTKQDYDILSKPFEANEHEWRKGGGGTMLCYVTEEVITPRLTEVDPAFGLTEPMVIEDIDMNISVKIGITVKGVTRWGIGTATRDSNTKEPTKSAVTDAYTRAARMFGIGLYLKGLKGVTWVNSEDTLAEWLANGMQSERKKSGGQSTGGKVTQLQQPTQQTQSQNQQSSTDAKQEFFGKSTLQIFSKTDKNGNRYYTISGATLYGRETFRALGCAEHILEQINSDGEHVLPWGVTVCYVMDGKFKNVIRVRRDDTGEVVDVKRKQAS